MIANTNSNRRNLEHHFEALLGFDGVSDLLDHLLSLSRTDARLYLCDLLSKKNDAQLEMFLDRIQNYLSGQVISPLVILQNAPSIENPKGELPMQELEENRLTKKKVGGKLKQNVSRQAPNTIPPITAATAATKMKTFTTSEQQKVSKSKPKSSTKTSISQLTSPRGAECGCYGTLHECLTNCLGCGRISCVNEGYGSCFFCGRNVKERSESPIDTSAMENQQQWLRRDKEFTKRTVVLDDQVDNYGIATSNWVDNEERVKARIAEDKRRKDMHEKKVLKLNIDFDVS